MHNTQGPQNEIVPALEAGLESRVMATFGSALRNWLLYDAPWDHDVRTIFRLKRDGHSEDSILAALRTAQRKECRLVYGHGHPQASLF